MEVTSAIEDQMGHNAMEKKNGGNGEMNGKAVLKNNIWTKV